MTLRRLTVYFPTLCAALLLAGCGNVPVQSPSQGHLRAESLPSTEARNIPHTVEQVAALTKPKPAAKTETYSVVVNDVRVQELLFALARDANINVDIRSGIEGTVTLNAINQTLPQLLNRIGKQVDIRWEFDGPNLSVMPDSPFLRTYKVDYVNINIDTTGTASVSSQLGSSEKSATGTTIRSSSKNHFWETLEANIIAIMNEQDKVRWETKCQAESSSAGTRESSIEASGTASVTATGTSTPSGAGVVAKGNQSATGKSSTSGQTEQGSQHQCGKFEEKSKVISNPETGVLVVRATSRQHEKIKEFIDQVLYRASRQVLIEATIAEVLLSNDYQQGINWGILPLGNSGVRLLQTASVAPLAGIEISSYLTDPTAKGVALKDVGIVSGSIKLLEAFGTVKVLSSPKLSVINNQTAVLKVIDNNVYFTIKADTTTNQTASVTTYTTTLNTVPVGFVMNVTPQISEEDTVLLNIRPSISRIIDYIDDPNPDLKKANVSSKIPVIRTREMESMIRVSNGNIAVMGGLMEDTVGDTDNAIPGVWKVPVLGNLFVNRDDKRLKTELVIFLRPIVIRDASLSGDYRAFRAQLPGQNFFKSDNGPQRQEFSAGGKSQ